MPTSDLFKDFLDNLKIVNPKKVSDRYGEITKALNKKFRDTESTTDNSLQVGSYGRFTGIKGIFDLDMIYIMPKAKWDTYKNGKQAALLSDVKNAIKDRYPKTEVRVNQLIVEVKYKNFHIEVQPAFEEVNQKNEIIYKFPFTYDGGKWKITKPRQEMEAVKDLNVKKNKNLRLLCKMIRAWRDKHGIVMGGLLIDTLAYNFLNSTSDYDTASFSSYDILSRDFFKYLSDQPDKDHYKAPGSNQNVNVKSKFQRQAKAAYNLCVKAIDAKDEDTENDKWKKVYGRNFPTRIVEALEVQKALDDFDNTEEFIENIYPISVKYEMKLDCEVSQNGYRISTLRDMLDKGVFLQPSKKLLFKVTNHNIPEPFEFKWKVLNIGPEAEKRNNIRGQIIPGDGPLTKNETTTFRGAHEVECYAIKDGIVVAKAQIDVPIR